MESAYDRKFAEMKKYIPFLESMIKRLESTSSAAANPRQAQLDKIRSLRDLLLDKKKRMKMENLLKCEQVLVNLYAKVEKKDSFSDINTSAKVETTASKNKPDLETVRNKLKMVSKIQEDAETLPEIARANDIELHYTGSKEPALFQRRPNISSNSPVRPVQINPNHKKTKSPQSQPKRSYTRVLVSPDRSPRRWSNSEQSADKPSFSRRSPPITQTATNTKKEKKKSKAKSRKTKDLNITLNVPEESLNSLNTKDILSRIITCSDGDVDIETLRELRSQIIGELTQTGKNDDISDLILKSYNKKGKSTKTRRKAEVEEGELSDSESEAIESIYGSLVVMDKDKQSVTQVKTTEDKDKQQRKIQICLVINSEKDESNVTNKGSDPTQIVDLCELEMFSENESDKSKEIISVDSDTPSSPPEKIPPKKQVSDKKATSILDFLPREETNKRKPPVIINEIVTVEDDTNVDDDQTIATCTKENTKLQSLRDNNSIKNIGQDDKPVKPITALPEKSPIKQGQTTNKNYSELIQTPVKAPEIPVKAPEIPVKAPIFIANFYKPIEEQPSILPTNTCADTLSKKDINDATHSKDSKERKVPNEIEDSEVSNASKDVEDPKYINDPKNTKDTLETTNKKNIKDTTHPNDTTDSQDTKDAQSNIEPKDSKDTLVTTPEKKVTPTKETAFIEKEKVDDSQQIPLLNEPTVPPKAKTDVLSEIDILQALKNEILSDVIAMPGSESVTPALHQPKLTKVASAQEVMPKKRISIESYKQKASTSTPNPLFLKKRNNRSNKNRKKKQSLKLTEKECERFNFPKRLSFDDDDDDDDDDADDISDDDFLSDDKDDTFGLDDIYGDLSPKSPDNEILSESSAPPVIIPVDPVKGSVVSAGIDVDMRAVMPIVSSLPKPALLPTPVPSSKGFGAAIPQSPVYGIDRPKNEANIEQSKKTIEKHKTITMDPRIRRDLTSTAINSPNPYAATNPDRTPRSIPYSNVVASGPSMTPIMNPNMTPSRTPVMTPSYMPSIPSLMTLNAMSFEMTPTHQTFELDDSSTRKHVYAPSFSMCDNRESVSKEGPHWEDSIGNKNDSRGTPRTRWDDSSTSMGPKWEDRDPRHISGQVDNSRYESYKPKYDKYNNRVRSDNYNVERRDSYSKTDCPTTPIPSFGWSECPPTPSSAFGRQEAPMTPSHQFGRSDCPTTPIHPFGRADCPSTPASAFGRLEPFASSSVSFGSQPNTPSHSFDRTECTQTPTHSFGRNDCPQTPSHSFGRSDIANNSNNQKYAKDPRINRRPDYDSSSYSERDRDYQNEHNRRKSTSYKPQSKYYSGSDTSRHCESERNVGRNDRNYFDDRSARHYDRDRREPSLGRSFKDAEGDRLYTRSRESRYDEKSCRYYDDRSRRDQRERSVGRIPETNHHMRNERSRSTSRAPSVGRHFDKQPNKDNVSLRSDTGRDLTINTSVNTTFQDFLGSGKPLQVFDYTLDARRQRAASVGRSLIRESSVGRTINPTSKSNQTSSYSINKNDRFKRASSVGRELVNTKSDKSFLEVKADFELYRSKLDSKRVEANMETNKNKSQVNSFSKKDVTIATQKDQKSSHSKHPYSPRKNNRDPRMRKEYPVENKSRYKIDRRSDLHHGQQSGIIYSNDNIAKGTIMGSGFGVKNYKIPKIKRLTVETPEETPKEKHELVDVNDSKDKKKGNEKVKENDIKIKPKDAKEIIKAVEVSVQKIKNKNQIETENKKVISQFLVNDSNKRVTRSKNKTETKSQDSDLNLKARKCKKSVIYDSESDSGSEKGVVKKVTREPDPKPKSPSKKANNITSKKESPVKAKGAQSKSSEGVLDSSFGIDDIEIFSENIGTDPVIENINALIADLDNDLDSSKICNDSFTTEIENMLEAVNSPEDNSLGDISEVIEKDLNESNEKLQQKLITDNLLQDNCDISPKTQKTLQEKKPVANHGADFDGLKSDGGLMSNDAPIAKPINMELSLIESNVTENILEATALFKDNEEIVSTTETEDQIQKNGIENTPKNEDQLAPDSTINKNASDKPEDGLPDSTIEMHCELSSDVTSTYDAAETSKKESEIQSLNQKDSFNSIGSLLSILQDKSKIKELLSMLGDQSSDNDKIKKKLEKLSEIVSDDEEFNEEHKKEDEVKDILPDSKIELKSAQRTDPMQNNQINEIEKEINHKGLLPKSNEMAEKVNVEGKEIIQTEKPEENSKDHINTQKEVVKEPDEKSPADKSTKITSEGLTSLDNEDKMSDINNKNEGDNADKIEDEEPDKIEDEEQDDDDDDMDDEPLIKTKKVTKKSKSRKSYGKPKLVNKNKPKTNQVAPANVPIKKPANRKKTSELQKLQDDIKEMFMSDDILNATGIRMCRLAKMVNDNDKDDLHDSEPVVVLEKVKGVQNADQLPKIRKKPGPKPKNKALQAQKSVDDKVLDKSTKSSEKDTKMNKPKNVPKYKPGPKSKKQKDDELDPYDFDTDSITDTNTTKESDEGSSDSENESLASSRSFGSSEILADTKKKPTKKRRGTRGWQSGIIKPKHKKKKEQKQETLSEEPAMVKPHRPITIPDMNCFTDKTYCFQKSITTYDCRLCVYSGTDIINHYKKQHPHTEIPLSRMDPRTAELAILQCEEINFQAIIKIPSEKYTCRFCGKKFGSNRVALETFFWHIVSSHTGEFKHLCSECVNVTRCPFNLDIPPPPKDEGQLIGYICGKCNYTQISLENLKTHVIVRHNDEQTEVYTINLAVMSNKTMKAMLRRSTANQPRVLRSLRSNPSAADTSDCRDDRSDVTESSDRNSEIDSTLMGTEEQEEEELKPKLDHMKAKLTFENDEPSDETSVKVEEEEQEVDDRDESSQLNDSFNAVPEPPEIISDIVPLRGNSDEIVDYPHFKRSYTDSGAKEYVCCINRNDNHYKTSLLISMKKHVQLKHSEKWDGFCCLCKVIVTLQGVQSNYKDCLSHFLDKHMDDFPILEKVVDMVVEENSPVPDLPNDEPQLQPAIPVLPHPLPALSPAISARVATPPVERIASPSYIAVRPLAELISKELVKEIDTRTEEETPITLPKIENIVSLGETTTPPSHPSPLYPTTVEPEPLLEKPFMYEDMQAKVMSKKHRVVLDAMMSKEILVRVFKCAGRFCSFTTDSAEDALLHATTHQRVGGEGALDCAYCNYDTCENGIDLVMHVFKEHSRCQFCCPLCFYRAAASQLVGAHYAKAHGGTIQLKSVLRSTATVASPASANSEGLLTRDVAVKHFVCNHEDGDCNFKTYTPGKFIEHLQQKHSKASSHSCNLCPSSFPTPTDLVVHQRSHGLRLYQCTWCVYGANNEQQLLAHAATLHHDRQPQAYVRVITSKDGSSTLRVLPLAYLNKSKVPVEDVPLNTTKENPVREAERSIELEKLIGHTLLMMESAASPAPIPIEEPTPIEEPVELSPEMLPEILTENVPSTSRAAKENVTIQEPVAKKSSTPEAIQKGSQSVKSEPIDAQNENSQADIICLDSDDEAETSSTIPEKSSANASDNVNRSNIMEEVTLRRLTSDVSGNNVTNDVSITKIIDESIRKSISEDDSMQNVIDLSGDDPIPPAPPGSEPIIKQSEIFKCPNCLNIIKNANALKKHVKNCGSQSNMVCPHKPCTAVITGGVKLIEHYSKVHRDVNAKNTMSNYCGICRNSFITISGAKMHIRAVHKVQHYRVTTTETAKGECISTLWDAGADNPPEPRVSARKTSTEIQRYGITDIPEPTVRGRKTSTEVKKRYGINDIDKLPISPILDSQVYCDTCEFGTKVRLNMVRHLQQHAGSMPVPHTAPVNPVPHLETNEMHFDRMVNLASSSIVTRAPDKAARSDAEPAVSVLIPPAESSRYPKYVPERQRYTCGAKACSYISVDMAMFRCHWETLHARDEEYRCVHCPPHQSLDTSIPLTAARILAHLRMHDVSLYACSGCSYYHYRKHLVEKHLSETHKDASVKIVREEGVPVPATPPLTVGAPTMDLKAWQCGLCKFTSMLRPEVVIHCGVEHQSKMQFKCAYCPFRTSTKENVVKHQTNAHPTKPEEVFYYFYREGSVPDEDGVPRWQKQRLKLGLEEPEVKTEPEPTESAPEQATVTDVTARASVDLNIVKKEVADEHNDGSELSIEELCKKFGQFCEPDGIKYKCCLCNVVREHSREDMQCHLYEELNYRRWECAMCSYKAFHKNGLNDHMTSEHSRQYTPPRALPVDLNIEKWVLNLLSHQASIIETNVQNLAVQKIQVERPTAAPASPKRVESPKPVLSTSDAELEAAFGDFGVSKNHQYSCPKCEFVTKDEGNMVYHLESELTKIRWGCTNCTGKFQTFHEAQFHCKSTHTGQPARPKEAVRDPSIRSGWINAVVSSQKQFMKCISETGREPTPEKNDDAIENSLLVARYDEPVQIEEHLAITGKRSAPDPDSDEERLVIDEPQKKKFNSRQCPYCDYTSTTPRCVKEHILKHYNLKPYICGHCSFDGSRITVLNHLVKQHPDKFRRIISVPIPDHLPTDMAVKSKREVKEPDDGTKKVCLYCEKSVSETEVETHVHANEPPEFAKRGDVVVKCSYCFALRLSVTSLQDHINAWHPGERMNYAYFKLLVDTREIHCCGHCHKKFKFLRDLKAHHTASHTSLSMSYTSIPFSLNLHTEGDHETNKRKLDDTAGPSAKRVARKSTTKLPNSAVAKKSTTKLPFTQPNLEEYSYFGTKPLPFDSYENVTLLMPMYNTTVEIDVKKLSGLLKIDPRVVIKDCES